VHQVDFAAVSSSLLEQARDVGAKRVREEIRRFGMPTGTIKKLVTERGFGFIDSEDGKEYFFHRSSTEGEFDSLRGGEQVTFEVESSPKGPRAANVRLA
jgi:CspA family cold shock protein